MQPTSTAESRDDGWVFADDAAPLPEGAIMVSLARWRAERDSLLRRNSPLGVILHAEDPVEQLAPDLGRINLVALKFDVFTDGRPYSAARVLRRSGYRGELRAVGHILRDQVPLLRRCGFDRFIPAGTDSEFSPPGKRRAFETPYQAAEDGRIPAYAIRGRSAG